ncbi:hypothetical protein J7L27_00960 [Candidatus Bathyarchaeota archaeon]|nr:hypothetical protein [Candidatus Bathyarchaeota archaeon]
MEKSRRIPSIYSLPLIYGPAKSRRLGLSLGINPSPLTCSFNCVYCECGEKALYVSAPEKATLNIGWKTILKPLSHALDTYDKLDAITFSGTGEPTLNNQLRTMIKNVKELTNMPIVVFTNASLIHRDDVKSTLALADKVVAKLNASTQRVFLNINRPVDRNLSINKIVKSLAEFRRKWTSNLSIEVLLVDLIGAEGNSNIREIRGIAEALRQIEPEDVQVHTIARFPLENFVRAVPKKKLEEAGMIFEETLGAGRVHIYYSNGLKYSIFRSTLLNLLMENDPKAYRKILTSSYKCPFTGQRLNPMNFCYCSLCGSIFHMKAAALKVLENQYMLLCPKCIKEG